MKYENRETKNIYLSFNEISKLIDDNPLRKAMDCQKLSKRSSRQLLR